MIVLHIAWISQDPFSGVNLAAAKHVLSQQRFGQIGLLNLENHPVEGVQNMFTYSAAPAVEQLPAPFHRPDLAVFHELYRPPYLKLSQELRRRGIPYVIFPHGGLTAEAQRRKALKKIVANRLLFHRFFQHAAAIQCLSQRELEHTAISVPKFIGTNGIEKPAKGKTAFSNKNLCFLYIGRMDIKIKGLDLLIAAIRLKQDFLRQNNCHFALYGPDTGKSHEALTRLIRRAGVGELVTLHGAVTGTRKEQALLSADYFIQTSRSEGMSMGILEALSYGLPCIVTSGTGMDRFVWEHGAGFGCETTAEGIAAAIHTAVMKAGERAAMSQAARSCVEETYDWDHIAAAALQTYASLISGGPSERCEL